MFIDVLFYYPENTCRILDTMLKRQRYITSHVFTTNKKDTDNIMLKHRYLGKIHYFGRAEDSRCKL